MNSGLYACAGASATASAAACAKRLDEPMTKESNVYFALKPPLSGRPLVTIRSTVGASSGSSPSSSWGSDLRLGDAHLDRPLRAGDVADGGADQTEEMTLDPVAREIVRDAEDEDVVRELEAGGFAEPRAVRRVVESPPEPTGDLVPQGFGSQLDLVLHPAASSSVVCPGWRA